MPDTALSVRLHSFACLSLQSLTANNSLVNSLEVPLKMCSLKKSTVLLLTIALVNVHTKPLALPRPYPAPQADTSVLSDPSSSTTLVPVTSFVSPLPAAATDPIISDEATGDASSDLEPEETMVRAFLTGHEED